MGALMCYAIRLRTNVQLEIGDCTQKLWRTGRAAASMTVNNVFFMASQISRSIRRHVTKGKANQLARPLHGHFGKPTLLWKMATEPDKAVDNTPDGVRAGSHNPQGEPPLWWRRSNPILHPLPVRMPAGHALFIRHSNLARKVPCGFAAIVKVEDASILRLAQDQLRML